MAIESLDELRSAFDIWRSKKQHLREPVPDTLLERARLAIETHGLGRVMRATRVDQGRLTGKGSSRPKASKTAVAPLPSFSRVEIVAQAPTNRPLMEVETPSGVKLRVFKMTSETLGLLSALCGTGGTR